MFDFTGKKGNERQREVVEIKKEKVPSDKNMTLASFSLSE